MAGECDSVRTVKKYLKNYNSMKVLLLNIEDEVAAIEGELQGSHLPIAHYGVETGGSYQDLTQTEQAAYIRQEKEQRIQELIKRRGNIERLIKTIDRTLSALDEEEQQIIRDRFIDGHKWVQIGMKHYCSERSVQKKAQAALYRIAFMMFGPADDSAYIVQNVRP